MWLLFYVMVGKDTTASKQVTSNVLRISKGNSISYLLKLLDFLKVYLSSLLTNNANSHLMLSTCANLS